jgi:hypothetical protein
MRDEDIADAIRAFADAALPHRLLRKVWLRAAFAVVRDDCITRGDTFPGDDLVPPDVHGEYVPTGPFYEVGSLWPDRLLNGLRQTQNIRDAFVNSAVLDPAQRARHPDPET